MKVSPYLQFTGNCAEAVAFYEKAFGVKAEIVRYKDAPPSEGYSPPPGTEDFIMHASITLGDGVIMFCDVPPGVPCGFGGGVAVTVTMDNVDQVKSCFNALKEGGEVGMELQETFWSKCFGSLDDKFGVSWMLSV
ncbi:MAG: VOC family protein [Treponema sp.]|jgi:PhnB protein|nr:VOC family protein [Treponema sp.]